MTKDVAKDVDTDRELSLEELAGISGGSIPELRLHIFELNPQPLPP